MDKNFLLFLENVALKLRIDSIRATTSSKSGHPTSCLSCADLVASIFFNFLKFDIKNPKNSNNDRFILSKGHAIPIIYAAWKQLGVINDEELMTLRKFNSQLEGHPTPRFIYNEAATGSLGQGLAIGVGMAINAKKDMLDYKTYVMLGDGELAEGSVWEAAELGSHYKLDNLIAIVDCNRLGQSGESINNHNIEKYAKKFEAFDWQTFSIDGHDIKQITKTLETAMKIKSQPIAIIAKTYKGYGLEDVQDKINFHGKPFKQEELENIISKLKNRFKEANAYKSNRIYTPAMPTFISNNKIKPINSDTDITSKIFDKNSKFSTREAFGFALVELGEKNDKIIVLDADVKNSTYTQYFEEKFPERFVQCFIAEQAMISISTGLQLRGKIPFAATFGAFLSRAADQIRMAGIGRNALRICGSHCGVSIGEDGPSQMALEDIALFRAIPNSIIFYPSDSVSTFKLMQLMENYNNGISYIRTTRSATPVLYNNNENFIIGGCKVLKQNESKDQICIIGAGITLHESLKAHEHLKEKNIYASIIDLYSIKPLDIQTIINTAKKSGNKILTVEDHYTQGGIGEAITAALINTGIKIDSLAVREIPRSGHPEELLSFEQIDAKNIMQKVLSNL